MLGLALLNFDKFTIVVFEWISDMLTSIVLFILDNIDWVSVFFGILSLVYLLFHWTDDPIWHSISLNNIGRPL